MSLSYTASKKNWVLDTRELRHRYYVQLSPDQEHVVVGSVHQGTRPPVGKWLELGTIRQKLAARYFVQQTSNNTLVPGLLIQSDTPPGNNWKDIQSQPFFHVIRFDESPYSVHEIPDETTFVTREDFIADIVNPALDFVYPDRDPEEAVRFKLLYWRGRFFPEFNDDQSYLTPFSTEEDSTMFGYFLTDSETYTDQFSSLDEEPADLKIKPMMPGQYSIVLAVLGDNDEIIDYIFFEYLIVYTLAA